MWELCTLTHHVHDATRRTYNHRCSSAISTSLLTRDWAGVSSGQLDLKNKAPIKAACLTYLYYKQVMEQRPRIIEILNTLCPLLPVKSFHNTH
jgi:hypothetical protein